MISIIVPVYNVEKYLSQCLDSLVNQTYWDIEIICVNDGSTDGSLAILEQYAAKDERIIIISRGNRGASESRSEGTEQAHGEWLMFVDSDDWLEPNTCERVMEIVGDADMVIFSYIREFRTTSAPKHIFELEPMTFENEGINWLFERLIAPGGKELRDPSKLDSLSTVWGKLYKTDIIRQYGITFPSTDKTGTLEDLVFNFKYFNHLKRANYLPDCLYHYRKANSQSIVNTHKPELDKKWLYVFGEMEKCPDITDKPFLLDALERRKALCLFGLGLNILFSYFPWRKNYQMLDDIICSDWYSAAIKKLDTKNMPIHWRTFYTASRHHQTWAIFLMLQVINRIINR